MSTAATAALLAVTFFGTALLGLLATQAAYRNGFWDGVLWERERPPTVPADPDPTPGAESGYPSKPSSAWCGWAGLGADLRQRNPAPLTWCSYCEDRPAEKDDLCVPCWMHMVPPEESDSDATR